MNPGNLGETLLCAAVGVALVILALRGDWFGLMLVLVLMLGYLD